MVHVTNNLILDGLTIHWHGQLQRGNPWMDGVAYVTQCPIMPREKFTYRFKAEQTGTHWYHAHFTNQRLDGLYGMLVVHKQAPAISYDLVTIQDWLYLNSISTHVSVPDDQHSYAFPGSGDIYYHPIIADKSIDGQFLTLLKFYSVIVNGRGRFTESVRTPLTQFQISEGERHRFRMAHVGSDYLLKVSIDDHPLIAVASDGYEFEPIIVDCIILHPGETMDFGILANQQPGSYWMRVDTLQGRPDQNGQIKGGKAVVSYTGYADVTEPTSTIPQCSQNRKCSVFNCPYPGYPTDMYTECISLADARSTLDGEFLKQNFGLLDTDYEERFYSFSLHHGHLTINGRIHEHSRLPFFQEDAQEYMDFCDLEEDCSAAACICTHMQNLPYNRTIQMVVFSPFAHHNLHLHGHNLAVLAIGFPSFNTTTGTLIAPNPDISCMDNPTSCLKFRWTGERPSLNLVNPPIKDTVVVPALGYVVVRFRTDNPGVWYFHCHHEFHMTSGMDMILSEAAEKRHPPPEGFPTCGDFSWSDDDYEDYISHTTDTPTEERSTAQPTRNTETPCDKRDREGTSFKLSNLLVGNSCQSVLKCAYIRKWKGSGANF